MSEFIDCRAHYCTVVLLLRIYLKDVKVISKCYPVCALKHRPVYSYATTINSVRRGHHTPLSSDVLDPKINIAQEAVVQLCESVWLAAGSVYGCYATIVATVAVGVAHAFASTSTMVKSFAYSTSS